MGRLGAGEMSYNSDLDLIFVYDGDGDACGGREIAARIAQQLDRDSRSAHARGLRLQDSICACVLRAIQGPLVASLDGFRDYHRQSSAVWERQALVRARVVAGDDALGEAVEAARVGIRLRPRPRAADVARDRRDADADGA